MVKLMDEENLLNEIVVSASRTQKDFLIASDSGAYGCGRN
jgi:hypothetical protein